MKVLGSPIPVIGVLLLAIRTFNGARDGRRLDLCLRDLG